MAYLETNIEERFDCHVHITKITLTHPQALAQFRDYLETPNGWPEIPLDRYVQYIREDNIKKIFALYDKPERLTALREAVPECQIDGYYWAHDPKTLNPHLVESLAKQGLLQGIKLHPIFDRYELTSNNISNVLSAAKHHSIPVLFHSDSRPESMYLTAPGLQEALIRHNPNVTTIIGHTGAYVPDQWTDSQLEEYYSNAEYSIRELVLSALLLARDYPNVYCDLTIVSHPKKAELVIDFIEKNPKVACKILLGTDFPIDNVHLRTQIEALQRGGLSYDILRQIINNRIEMF